MSSVFEVQSSKFVPPPLSARQCFYIWKRLDERLRTWSGLLPCEEGLYAMVCKRLMFEGTVARIEISEQGQEQETE